MKKKLAIVVLGVILATGVGCRKTTVTNTPPGVSSTEVADWYDAVGANQEIARAAKGLTDLAISLHEDHGVFPDEDSYQKTLEALGKLDLVGLQATSYLRTVPQNWNQPTAEKVGGYVDQMLVQFQIATTNGLDGIKNPATQATITAFIQTLRSALQLQVSLLTSKGVTVHGNL